MGDSGHTLCHTGFLQLVVEGAVCVLESSVGMEDGTGVRIAVYRPVKGFEYQRIIIPLANYVGNNPSVVEIQDCTKIDFAYIDAFVPLELCDICEPLFVGCLGMKISVQDVLRNILRVLCTSGAAMIAVFDGGFDILLPADPQDPFIVDMNSIVMAKVIVDPAIALFRAFHINLLYFLCDLRVFYGPDTFIAGQPPIICSSGHPKQRTSFPNSSAALLAVLLDCTVNVTLPYL